jgi:hypothetical protein
MVQVELEMSVFILGSLLWPYEVLAPCVPSTRSLIAQAGGTADSAKRRALHKRRYPVARMAAISSMTESGGSSRRSINISHKG